MANEFLDYQGLDYFKYKILEGIDGLVDAVPTSRTVNGKALASDIILAPSDIGALAVNGNARSATKLAATRTIRTNLASTSSASFDGTANITPGVTGTLPIANGGTGGTTKSAALTSLGAVPTTRTINGKALSSNITLTPDDIGAISSSGGGGFASLHTGSYTGTGADIVTINFNFQWTLAFVFSMYSDMAIFFKKVSKYYILIGNASNPVKTQTIISTDTIVNGQCEMVSGVHVGVNKSSVTYTWVAL